MIDTKLQKRVDLITYPIWDPTVSYYGGELVVHKGEVCIAMNGVNNIPIPRLYKQG